MAVAGTKLIKGELSREELGWVKVPEATIPNPGRFRESRESEVTEGKAPEAAIRC